ncbi:multidrug resistance efflux pump [Chryseobacterium sp. StRB126]|uniref:hypothetical protein n=1 Tax=Chryseobacterium sp. StRB126 TaxID=878220 RepID=UPI0004E9891E|nr:hypothetical protein [Chryseobacterium sp. StRB126]BAP30135.1 multidrug resistance efflux pump [Chryseobacterium sp. StRB126]
MAGIRDILLVIQNLSTVTDLKFVGGTSLFIQEKTTDINDVDVLVQDIQEISKVYNIILIDEPVYKFENRRRGYCVHNDVMIDVFIQENNEETILVGTRAKCSTIDAQIVFLEKTLSLNLLSEKRQSTIAEIHYLKSIR